MNEEIPHLTNSGQESHTIAIILARMSQSTGTVLISLIEHQPGNPLPVAQLDALANELTWISNSIHQTIGQQDG